MNLLIYSMEKARDYVPTDRTLVMRIFDSYNSLDRKEALPYEGMAKPKVKVFSYVFDDVPAYEASKRKSRERLIKAGHKILDKDIASTLISDFSREYQSYDTLLVHCTNGNSRSTAVGTALKEIFRLGGDTEAMKEQYPMLNTGIYDIMIKSAVLGGYYVHSKSVPIQKKFWRKLKEIKVGILKKEGDKHSK